MIYLDNGATTQPELEVIDSFQRAAASYYANPSSIHQLGATVSQLQRKAREQVAQILEVNPDEIIFTSGGTEGNNLAIKGIALQHKQRGNHIITTKVEHPSVYEACKALEKLGFRITYLNVDKSGIINVDELKNSLSADTILVSIMHVNNEIGTIQPIEQIGQLLVNYPKVFFHVDAVQGLGKVPLNIKQANIHLCTFSGHKIHGLKGTGALYIKKGTTLFPLSHGGEQEFGIRSGTENVAGNVSFARALRLVKEKEKNQRSELYELRNYLMKEISKVAGVYVHSTEDGAPHIVHVSVPPLKPEVVIHALYEKGIVISTQSACSSKKNEPSRVLLACGNDKANANAGLRISLSYYTTREEIITFLQTFKNVIEQLKGVIK